MRATGRTREQGAALVEFALVIPLLTLFLFGIVQFGIAYDKQQSINSAAREGARLGALQTSTLADIGVRAVESYNASAAAGDDPTILVSGGLSDGTVTPLAVRCPGGNYLEVSPSPSDDDCANGSGISEGDADEMPCGSVAAPPDFDFIRVTASTPYDITIPFFGVMTVDIDSEAEFRCE